MSPESEQTASNGLAGLVIGVPAARRAEETAKLIRRWGGSALIGPTVEEVPVEDPGPVIQATREVIDAPAGWSVHLTGVGTRRWFDIAGDHDLLEPLIATLGRVRVVARGAKASSALRSYQLEPEWIPEGETSREIASWMQDKVAPGDVVAVQRHGEAVPGLTSPLVEAGARIIELATYRWEIPADRRPAEELVNALIQGRVHALVLTSAPQMRNLFRVAEDTGSGEELHRAFQEHVFVASVGVVASEALHERGLTPGLVAHPPRMGALIRSLAGARQQILDKTASHAGKAP